MEVIAPWRHADHDCQEFLCISSNWCKEKAPQNGPGRIPRLSKADGERAFALRLQGKSYVEIGQILGCDPRTVQPLIDRVLGEQ